MNCLRLVGVDEEALFDERLQTVPDARITHGRWSLLDSGAVRVSGVLPAGVTPSELVVGVSRGDADAEISLGAFGSAAQALSRLDPDTAARLGRLLSVTYAVSAKDEVNNPHLTLKIRT